MESIKAREKKSSSKSYLFTLCCACLSLMNNKSAPDDATSTTKTGYDEFVAAFESDDGSPKGALQLKPGDSPMFYTVLCFLDGFNKEFFEGAC